MRVQSSGSAPFLRLLVLVVGTVVIGALTSGLLLWCWTEAASVLSLHGMLQLPLGDAAHATWQIMLHGEWRTPGQALPRAAERADAPRPAAYLFTAVCLALVLTRAALLLWRAVRALRSGSPLGRRHNRLARVALDRGWVHQRTWASTVDLRRLWVPAPVSGRAYLGLSGGIRPRMLAAELEVQPMLIAPPRAGKTSGYVIPWLLEHDGPALVLSTKRDVYEATCAHRRRLGRTWVYDPFGDPHSAGFTPLVPAASWPGAVRVGAALASAAHPDASNAANEFWDKEAASMLAPLLHAAALSGQPMSEVIRLLDARELLPAVTTLRLAGAEAAATQLEGVGRRDERNRETTVMSALNLLRAYRYPQVIATANADLTPEAFLDGGANTIYVIAAGHDQDALRPVILALVSAIYETAIVKARETGPLDPALFMIMDEAANIAPIRSLASWLSQCGDHGVTIATIWQSIAQIDQRYGRPARDAICAASTAQVFIPPLADPPSTNYLAELLGEEPIANASTSGGAARRTLSAAQRKVGPAPWLRQIARGQAILIYRDLPPAIVHAPGWYEDPRFTQNSRPAGSERHRE